MAEVVSTNALTTLARVKDRLGISVPGHDAVLTRVINAASAFIEKQVGRTFVEREHEDELYSIRGATTPRLWLRNGPVSAVASVERAYGIVGARTWTPITTFEPPAAGGGIVTFAEYLPQGENTVRVTYTGGYLVNWNNAGDDETHTLPADVTDLCERLVTRWWKRRESEGKSSEGAAGNTINFLADLTADDKMTMDAYRPPPVIA